MPILIMLLFQTISDFLINETLSHITNLVQQSTAKVRKQKNHLDLITHRHSEFATCQN